LESTTQHQNCDIDVILEQYHLNTKINKNLPYYVWIKYSDDLPLDECKPILLYNPQYDSLYDGLSFVALQHSLYSNYMKYDNNQPTHWMRIKKPEV
jgi:hypothetical protein